MATSYIPATDSALSTWGQNFATVIAANPAAYGLTSTDATNITSAANLYTAAYELLTSPATRNPTTVAAKDVQKAASLIVFRSYAQIIQNNAGVSNDDKSAAGLTVRSTARTPIPAPGTIPILALVGGQPGVATLRFADSASPTTKAKPYGTLQMNVFVADTTGTSTRLNPITKSPFVVNTPSGQTGRTLTLTANWQTRRGLTGSLSAPLTIIAP